MWIVGNVKCSGDLADLKGISKTRFVTIKAKNRKRKNARLNINSSRRCSQVCIWKCWKDVKWILNFRESVRARRTAVEKLCRSYMQNINQPEDLQMFLDNISATSICSKL